MKTILIPDIHTHFYWVEEFLKDREYDEVIFLGDYFDDYGDTRNVYTDMDRGCGEGF